MRALLDVLAALALAVLLVWSAWLIIAVLAVLAALGAVTGAYGCSLVRRPRHRACAPTITVEDLADPTTLLPWEDPPDPGDIGDGVIVPDRLPEPLSSWPSVEDTKLVLRALLEPAGPIAGGPDAGKPAGSAGTGCYGPPRCPAARPGGREAASDPDQDHQ